MDSSQFSSLCVLTTQQGTGNHNCGAVLDVRFLHFTQSEYFRDDLIDSIRHPVMFSGYVCLGITVGPHLNA